MRRFAVGLVFTIASVALLIRLIDWQTALTVLERADYGFIALAVTALVFSLILKTVRWKLLLPDDAGVKTSRLYRILHISFMLNNVLPARLGDVARVALTTQQPGLRIGSVVSSLLTERVTDSVTLLTCFVVVSPFLPIPDRYVSWLHTAWYVLAALVALTLLVVIMRKRAARLASRMNLAENLPHSERLKTEAESFGAGFRQLFSRGHRVQIWGASMLAWGGAFAINYLLMKALKIDAPVTVAVLLTCVTNLAMLIPSSPGYIGVFHVAAVSALVPFNVDKATALSFAIIAHLVNVLPVSILGALFLLGGRDSLHLNLRGRPQPTPLAPETPADSG